MSSINQQQPEKNHEDLHGLKAGKKIKELSEKNETCYFCTAITSGKPLNTRPMSLQKTDDDGTMWFVSADDSHLNRDIMKDDNVHLLFQGGHSDFLSIYGSAIASKDKAKIKELWKPLMKTWFTEGENDPRITVVKVTPEDGYYWDTKHGSTIAFLKMAVGALTGQTLDDSIEGKLKA